MGHSYGGLTILKAQSKLDAAVLWDPTHGSYWLENPEEDPNFPEKTVGEIVIGTGGYGYILSTSIQRYDHEMGDTTAWAENKGYPLKVISAGKGAMAHLGKRYVEAADEPNQHKVIEEAHHQFEDSDFVISELFVETLDWLKKY